MISAETENDLHLSHYFSELRALLSLQHDIILLLIQYFITVLLY